MLIPLRGTRMRGEVVVVVEEEEEEEDGEALRKIAVVAEHQELAAGV